MYLKYLKIAFKCFFLLLYCLYALCTYFISTCPRCLRSLEKLFGLVFLSCPHTLVVETEPPDPLDNGNPQVLSVQYGFFSSAEILPNTAPGASSCPFHSPFSSCFSLHVHHTILSLLQQAFHSCLVRGVTPSTPSPSLALLLKRHFLETFDLESMLTYLCPFTALSLPSRSSWRLPTRDHLFTSLGDAATAFRTVSVEKKSTSLRNYISNPLVSVKHTFLNPC